MVTVVAARPTDRKRVAHVSSPKVVLQNVEPDPNFLAICTSPSVSVSCVGSEIQAINNARQLEGVAPVVVNLSALSGLSNPEQILAITNLERTARGLAPAVALTTQLDTAAAGGAISSTDPSLSGWTLFGGKAVTAWASNWAGGLDVLGADYLFMYDDGVGYNVDCPIASASGCWGHRKNVLVAGPSAASCTGKGGRPELLMGAAVLPASYQGTTGIGELLVDSCGGLPTDTIVTWRQIRRELGIAAAA
jgi:hypothetical protein